VVREIGGIEENMHFKLPSNLNDMAAHLKAQESPEA